MVMDRIGGFANLGREFLEKFQGASRTGSPERELSLAKGSPSREMRTPASDSAEISSKAHQLNALRHAVEVGRQALESLPAVRKDRVAAARARLNTGYYNSAEVRGQVAERFDAVARHLEEL